jgi:hypothetical protein
MMTKGDLMVLRPLVTLIVSSCLVVGLGLARVGQLFAQDAKKAAPPAATAPASPAEAPAKDAAKPEAPQKEATKKAEAAKTEAAQAPEPPLPPIPPEVEVKLNAARKAVAEAIVAAQDAGLVETSIEPPPILDILINGRAMDARTLKNATAKKPYGVSPEVFGAWFTSYGKLEGINYAEDVRIINPSAGLKQWYDQRARMLDQYIQEVRKAKGQTVPAKAAAKPAEAPKADAKKAPDTKK